MGMTLVTKESSGPLTDPTWRDKLRAWWHGDDYVMRHMVQDFSTRPAQAPAEIPADIPLELPTIQRWTPRRQQVVQRLFGAGFNQPGGEEREKPQSDEHTSALKTPSRISYA